MYKLKYISYKFLEPQELSDPTKCVITTHLDNGNPDEVSTLDYMLVGMQLNPNYMTTDRLFMLLEDHFIEHKVTDYIDKLDEFVVGFIKHLMKLKGK